MKWSEMERKLRLQSPVYHLDGMLKLFKQKAEEAGVAWDPEDLVLPEKIVAVEVSGDTSGELEVWDLRPEGQEDGWTDHQDFALIAITYQEAERRYNAWKELKRKVQDLERAAININSFAAFREIRKILESGKS